MSYSLSVRYFATILSIKQLLPSLPMHLPMLSTGDEKMLVPSKELRKYFIEIVVVVFSLSGMPPSILQPSIPPSQAEVSTHQQFLSHSNIYLSISVVRVISIHCISQFISYTTLTPCFCQLLFPCFQSLPLDYFRRRC